MGSAGDGGRVSVIVAGAPVAAAVTGDEAGAVADGAPAEGVWAVAVRALSASGKKTADASAYESAQGSRPEAAGVESAEGSKVAVRIVRSAGYDAEGA